MEQTAEVSVPKATCSVGKIVTYTGAVDEPHRGGQQFTAAKQCDTDQVAAVRCSQKPGYRMSQGGWRLRRIIVLFGNGPQLSGRQAVESGH